MVDPNILDVAGLGAIMATMGTIVFFVAIAAYVYGALVWMTIAKKLGYDKPWLAWVPIANLFLFPILAKKHWAMGFLLFLPIVNIVLLVMWIWSIYEKRNYPGWLSLVPLLGLIPILGIVAQIANIVIWALVAWVDRPTRA